MAVLLKDPAATLDYSFDWSTWLSSGEVISASSWSISGSSHLTLSTDASSTDTTTAWVTGGRPSYVYRLVNKVTTNNTPARVDERTITLRVMDR